MITFHVFGKPATQGSKKGHVVKTKAGKHIAIIREEIKRLSQWRQQVAEVAMRHISIEPITDNVGVGLVFFRARPKSHFGTGRNAGNLKASAPKEPGARPDSGKLGRAVHDAMSGIVYRDDSQIVTDIVLKRWGNAAGVFVAIGTVEEFEKLYVAGLEKMARLKIDGGAEMLVEGPVQGGLF